MNNQSPGRGPFVKAAGIILLALLADQICAAELGTWESDLVSIHPMVVFLDIPVPLPLSIALVPVFLFFILLFQLLPGRNDRQGSEPARGNTRQKMWQIGRVISVLPLSLLAGGLLYMLIHDLLPKRVQNGIESFGINVDLRLPWPGIETIHLKGSMIILASCWIGWRYCRRKIRSILAVQPMSPAAKPLQTTVVIQPPARSHSRKKTPVEPGKERAKAGYELVR
ncbi:MAG TPA: hypothetical protein VMI35_14325 [Puia sp.]|nr:hypothetical protein [Puia sp.]